MPLLGLFGLSVSGSPKTYAEYSHRTTLRGLVLLADEPPTPSMCATSSGKEDATGSIIGIPAPAPSDVSLDNPRFAGSRSDPSFGFDLADIPSSLFPQVGSWPGTLIDQIDTANSRSTSLPVLGDFETALLQDWSHQGDTSE